MVGAVAVLYVVFVRNTRSSSDFPADSSHSETGEALYSTTSSVLTSGGFISLEDGDGAGRSTSSAPRGQSPTRVAGEKVRSLLAQSANFLRDRVKRKPGPGRTGGSGGPGGSDAKQQGKRVGNRKEYEMVRSPFSILGDEEDDDDHFVEGGGLGIGGGDEDGDDEEGFRDSDGDRAYDSAQVDIRV